MVLAVDCGMNVGTINRLIKSVSEVHPGYKTVLSQEFCHLELINFRGMTSVTDLDVGVHPAATIDDIVINGRQEKYLLYAFDFFGGVTTHFD